MTFHDRGPAAIPEPDPEAPLCDRVGWTLCGASMEGLVGARVEFDRPNRFYVHHQGEIVLVNVTMVARRHSPYPKLVELGDGLEELLDLER